MQQNLPVKGTPITLDGKITVQYLQAYIKSKDHSPQHKHDYFQKLAEEVEELSLKKN